MNSMNRVVNLGTFRSQELFSKYITQVALFDPAGNVIAASNLVQSMTIDYTSDPGELRAGARNPVQIMLPTNANATFALTFATSELEHIQIATGAKMGFGAPIPQSVGLTLSATNEFTLPVNAKPIRELGVVYPKPIARIDGIAYEIKGSPGAYTVSYPAGEVGKKYCLTYFEFAPEAKLLKVSTNIIGMIARVVAIVPLFAKPATGDVSANPEVGFRMHTFPTAQANGAISIPASQDTPATMTINFTALPFTETADSDEPCISLEQYFGYHQDYIYEQKGYSNVHSIWVPGGIVTANELETVHVPIMMRRDSETGPVGPILDSADFEFEVEPPTIGSIDTSNPVAQFTGGVAGNGILKIKGKVQPDLDLSHLSTSAAILVEA